MKIFDFDPAEQGGISSEFLEALTNFAGERFGAHKVEGRRSPGA